MPTSRRLHVDLDPSLARDLTPAARRAVEVHVLRARADLARGPQRGDAALLMAVRATELEHDLLRTCGLEHAAGLLAVAAVHPAVTEAVSRWRLAHEMSARVLAFIDPAERERDSGT